jgi:hypothetical protein
MLQFVNQIPKWARWFSLGVVLFLVGLTILLVNLLGSPAANSVTPQQAFQQASTAAALTLIAEQASANPTAILQPTREMSLTPSPSNFPVYAFTPPTLQSQSTPAAPAIPCDDSIYISDVTIPDGTILAPGMGFTKTWMFENTGSCTWTTSYQLTFVSGDLMGGTATNLTSTVAPYRQVQASVSLIAPLAGGTSIGYWRLADAQGNPFGGIVFVKIVVVASTGTPSPTPTTLNTSVSTSTSTALPETETTSPSPTGTATETDTPLPSSTPTPKATST